MNRKESEVWKFFEIVNGKLVKCNFCEQECSAIITNMKKHLVNKHPPANEILEQIEETEVVPLLVDEEDSSDNLPLKTIKQSIKLEMGHNVDEAPMSRRRSLVWNFFDNANGNRCKCRLCGKVQSSVISNMKKHLRAKHPTVNNVQNLRPRSEIKEINVSDFSEPEKLFEAPKEDITNDCEELEEVDSQDIRDDSAHLNRSGRRSMVWEFFDKIDHRRAICRLCNKEQSCVTSNMRLHLENKHSGEQIIMETPETVPFDERFNDNDSDDSFNYPEEAPTSSVCSRKSRPVQIVDKTLIKKEIDSDETNSTELPNTTFVTTSEPDEKLMERKRSSVWQYFQIISANRATCNLCGKEQSSVISNVKKHLMAVHPAGYKEMRKGTKYRKPSASSVVKRSPPSPQKSATFILPKKRQFATRSTNNFDNVNLKKSSRYKTRQSSDTLSEVETIKITSGTRCDGTNPQITERMSSKADQILLRLIIKHFQDYNIVQDDEIVKFIRTINKSYKLPTKDTIANNLVPDLYEQCLFQTKLQMKSCKKYCMTVDCWSNVHATNFITVTVHFVDDKFVLNSLLLDCCVIQKQDTPANLAQEFRGVLTNWNLDEDDVNLAVLDSSISNIKCVFTDELKWDAQDCFANIINSIAKDSFSNEWIQNIIDKVKDLISHFKGCEFSTETLMEFQRERNIASPLKLIKDFPRCWNSTFHMLQRFIELEDGVKHSLSLVEKELQTLSILEWEVVRQLVNCVKPIDHVMSTIKKETDFCAASLVVPLINGLKNIYNNYAVKQLHNPVKEVINNIIQSITEHFDSVENVDAFILATFLDPRFKNKAFSTQAVGDQVRDKIVNILNSEESNSFQNKRPKQMDEDDPQSEFWSFFQDSINRPANNSRVIIEVQRYLEDGIVPRTESPLTWWSKNHVSFPRLAELARERLCCVASSVPCDRYFSKRGQSAIENRMKLSTKKTQMLVFLNANYITEDK